MDITDKILEYIDDTRDFFLENAPELLQEAFRFFLIKHVFSIICYFALSAVSVCVLTSFNRWVEKEKEDNSRYSDDGDMAVRVFSLIIIIISSLFLLSHICQLIRLCFCPKFYLLWRLHGD